MANSVIILGSQGMLGQELVRVFSSDSHYRVLAWDKDELDLTDFYVLEKHLKQEKPMLVVNAAAYNAVDLCEQSDEEYRKALALNRDLPRKLAELSRDLDFLLVHYSTDYVFDGDVEAERGGCGKPGCCGGSCGSGGTHRGYPEDALPNPLSRYADSKFLGEQAVIRTARKYYLIRLSKLFGKMGHSAAAKRSFFDVMLELGKTKPEVQAVDSEKSCFTYAPDLALATKNLVESGEGYGIYHRTNHGAVTWYEAVLELYKQAGITAKVIPVGSEAFPRPARRPAFSVLLSTKLPPMRPYTEALKEYLADMV